MSRRKARAEAKRTGPVPASLQASDPRAVHVAAATQERTWDIALWTMPLLLIGIGLAAYHNSFTGPFLLDDEGRVVQNLQIRKLWPLWDVIAHSGRPVVELSMAVNYALGGLNVWGYHVFNVAVHLLAGLVLFGIARRTLESEPVRARYGGAARWLALAIAALWIVHPLQTAAVTYVSQRAESLMGLFYLLTLYCGIRGSQSPRPRRWFIAAVCACALGMGSKEVMVTAPIMMLVYDRVFLSSSFEEIVRRRWGFYLGLCATWLILGTLLITSRVEAQSIYVAGLTSWRYAMAQFGIVVHYLRLALWPHPLVFDYMWALPATISSVLPSAAIVIALAGATVLALWRLPWVGFWGVWFFLILAPTSSILPIADLAFEHRMYLPLAAVVVLAVLGAHEALGVLLTRLPALRSGRRWLEMGLMVTIVGALAVTTVRRNEDYTTSLAIWSDTSAKRPDNSRAHFNLGVALYDRRRVDEAIAEFAETVRLKPDFADAHFALGYAKVGQGKVDAGIAHYAEAMRLMPDDSRVHFSLGVALAMQGKTEAAIAQYAETVRLAPDFAEAHNYLGAGLATLGKTREALPHLEKAVRLRPGDADARRNLGLVLVNQGRIKEAIAEFEEALRLRPRYREALLDLNNARARQRTESIP